MSQNQFKHKSRKWMKDHAEESGVNKVARAKWHKVLRMARTMQNIRVRGGNMANCVKIKAEFAPLLKKAFARM